MSKDQARLEYFFSERNGLVVVSFAGEITRETVSILEQCQNEIVSKSPKWVILYLRDVGNQLDLNTLPAFARLQKVIRELPAELRLSSLHPELKKLLEAKGLLRPNELTNNLQDALQSISRLPKKQENEAQSFRFLRSGKK